MYIYLLLVSVVLLVPFVCAIIEDREKRNTAILFFSLAFVFLVMALKAPTVGRDIPGYKRIYEIMQFQPWDDFNISWMEWGYELLMMVFTHIFHAPFQVFMICIYGYVFFSYYVFFKRYSMDYTTSVILYICFTFFTFDASAVRTMMGVATCLFAVPMAERKGKGNTVYFIIITLIAAQIHKSAYIFFVVYFVIKMRFNIYTAILYVGIPIGVMFFKSNIYMYINMFFKTVQESSTSIGGNLLIYIVNMFITLVIWIIYQKEERDLYQYKARAGAHNELKNTIYRDTDTYFNNSGLATRLIYMGIVLQLFSSGTVLSRMAQYVQFFILILLPNNLKRLDVKFRTILKIIIYIGAILYFYRYSLAVNALDIVPYKFFWSAY